MRLSLQVARNFERGKIIEFGGDDFAELGRRCGLGECLLSILRFLASMSSVLFLPLAAIGKLPVMLPLISLVPGTPSTPGYC